MANLVSKWIFHNSIIMNMTKIQTLIFLRKKIKERREREREKAWFMVVEQPKINSSFDLNRHNAPAQKKMPNSSFQNVRGRTQANTPSLCPMLMALRLPTSQWLFWVR